MLVLGLVCDFSVLQISGLFFSCRQSHGPSNRLGNWGITAHNTNATSVLPGRTRSIVALSKGVFYNQTFTTDYNGRIQARLLDGSSFTLSANTSLTIDSFVYDPAESTGETVASVASGVVQFIGGELSKFSDQVVIETNVASVGIRGGIAVILVSDNAQDSEFSFHFGTSLDITLNDGRSYRLTKPVEREAKAFPLMGETIVGSRS